MGTFDTIYTAKNWEEFEFLVYKSLVEIPPNTVVELPLNKWSAYLKQTLQKFINQNFLCYELEFNNDYTKIRLRDNKPHVSIFSREK
jgi:hypothetical protein